LPILPVIDLLILMSTASLLTGFLLKAIAITTRYRPTLLGFSSLDFVIITAVCLGLAMVLAARTWVKLNEPRLLGNHARRGERRGVADTYGDEMDAGAPPPEGVRADPR
jgi:hypothetical protein